MSPPPVSIDALLRQAEGIQRRAILVEAAPAPGALRRELTREDGI